MVPLLQKQPQIFLCLIRDIPIEPNIRLQFLYLLVGGLKLTRKLLGNAPRVFDLLFSKMSGLLQEVKKGFPFAVQRSAPSERQWAPNQLAPTVSN